MAVTFQSTTLATPPSGTTVDIGSGAAGSGTQRVLLATDQAALPITDNGGSVTVDGTVAATQSGNWSARMQDGAGNALTSATRGSERAVSVQIVDGSGTQVTTFGGSGGTASNFGSAYPTAGTAIGAKDSAGTNMVALNVDASGFLKVNVAAGGGSGGTSSTVGSAVPSTATAIGASDATNLQIPRVFDTDSGAGTQYTLGVTLRKTASGGSAELGTATDPMRTDPTGSTTQPVSGTVTANIGTGTLAAVTTVSTVTNVATIGTSVTPGTAAANLGKAEDAVHASGDTGVMALAVRNDSVAALAGTSGDYIPITTDSVGRVWASAKIDTALPAGTAALGTVTLDDAGTGWSVSALISANSTNATSAKGSAGRLHGWAVYNSNASARYLKLYNKASAPTVGTDTPFMRVLIPAGGGANICFPSPGITMGTGIAYALTTGAADSDTGAVATSEILVNVYYS